MFKCEIVFHSQRGFGVGKWNGPGGKFDAALDTTMDQTAIRECQEEVGLTPKNITLRFALLS
jgi:8-oxo-dGTP pyrophosphatase MutT (NUDIX family)